MKYPSNQEIQTYMNSKQSAAKNPNQTFHPTPVRSAILSILFIVPLSLTLAFPNESFIFSANAVLSLISSPIFIVISFSIATFFPISETCSSFCDSSSSSTDALYWPFWFGDAARYAPAERLRS